MTCKPLFVSGRGMTLPLHPAIGKKGWRLYDAARCKVEVLGFACRRHCSIRPMIRIPAGADALSDATAVSLAISILLGALCATCRKLREVEDVPDHVHSAVARARKGSHSRIRAWRLSQDARNVVAELDLGWSRPIGRCGSSRGRQSGVCHFAFALRQPEAAAIVQENFFRLIRQTAPSAVYFSVMTSRPQRSSRQAVTVSRRGSDADDIDEVYFRLSAAQRVSMMWQLARDAYAFAGDAEPESRLQRHSVNIQRRKR